MFFLQKRTKIWLCYFSVCYEICFHHFVDSIWGLQFVCFYFKSALDSAAFQQGLICFDFIHRLLWAWQIHGSGSNIYGRGSTYMVAMPSLFKIYVVWIYIQRLIKQTSLEFRQKYSSRMWVWLNYLLCHALLKKILCTGGRFSCILTYSFIHKEFVECLCVNSCDLSKK